MYHPDVTAIQRGALEQQFREILPNGLTEHTVGNVQDYQDRMRSVFDPKTGKQVRGLDREEQAFIVNEQLLGKVDFPYWAERYCVINLAASETGRLYPLWTSQRLIIEAIGRVEKERFESGHPDGILYLVLKARQLGASTLSEAIICHRSTTHAHTLGMLASDTPDSSAFLFDMYERMIDNLPWYMRPQITERVKNDEVVYATGSHIFVGASKSTRKGGQSEGGRGQIGRGKTLSLLHLSELATWEHYAQIHSALMPAVPVTPRTFGAFESTAQGRNNGWHLEWKEAKAGRGRFFCIFIPWYAERTKYWRPAPDGWLPSPDTVAHAQRAEANGPRWMSGTVRLTKEQLYWYESERMTAANKGELSKFLEEYPADDEEAFQHAGRSVFSIDVRERVKAQARPLRAVIEVKPQAELTLGRV